MFFISIEEFERILKVMCNDIWKIRSFCKFAVDNFENIEERGLIRGDIKIFVDYISASIKKDFVHFESMFEKTCIQFPFWVSFNFRLV